MGQGVIVGRHSQPHHFDSIIKHATVRGVFPIRIHDKALAGNKLPSMLTSRADRSPILLAPHGAFHAAKRLRQLTHPRGGVEDIEDKANGCTSDMIRIRKRRHEHGSFRSDAFQDGFQQRASFGWSIAKIAHARLDEKCIARGDLQLIQNLLWCNLHAFLSLTSPHHSPAMEA